MNHNEIMKGIVVYFQNKQSSGQSLTQEETNLMKSAEFYMNSFVISSLSFGDLETKLKLKKPLPDNVMSVIAEKMGDDYCEQLFWIHLPIIVEYVIDRMGISIECDEEEDDEFEEEL